MIFNKGAKVIQWGKGWSFQQTVPGEGDAHMQRMKLDPYLTSYINTSLKWIKDVNIRAKAIKLLEENIGGKLYDIGFGNDFLDMSPKPEAI